MKRTSERSERVIYLAGEVSPSEVPLSIFWKCLCVLVIQTVAKVSSLVHLCSLTDTLVDYVFSFFTDSPNHGYAYSAVPQALSIGSKTFIKDIKIATDNCKA